MVGAAGLVDRARFRHPAPPTHRLGQLKKASMASATRRDMNVYYRAQRDAVQAQRLVLDPHCC
jgi:hypothetical protein